MPQISKQKKERIQEQILHHLFLVSPAPQFTSQISSEIARDEEFTKSILQELVKKKLVIEIKKNPHGIEYKLRRRWLLSNEAYKAYKKYQ